MTNLRLVPFLLFAALTFTSLACPTRTIPFDSGIGGRSGTDAGAGTGEGKGGIGGATGAAGAGKDGSAGGGSSGAGTGGAIGGPGGANGGLGGDTGGHSMGNAGSGQSSTSGSSGNDGAGAPYVVNTYPADGQVGVTSDVTITVTFSTPMNPNSVKAAYVSSTLLPGQVTFMWNSEGTVLTITPNSPLSYVTGSSPSITANSYAYKIDTSATSQAGVALASPLSVTFSTLKRVSTSVSTSGVYDMLEGTPDGSTPLATTCSGTAQPGVSAGLAFVAYNMMYVTFALPQPPQGLYSVESATLLAAQLTSMGTPYATSSLICDQLTYESPPTFADNQATPIRGLGVFATSSASPVTLSVLPTIQEAFTGTGHGVLFRFEFGAYPSTTAYANFSCSGWTINFTYLTS